MLSHKTTSHSSNAPLEQNIISTSKIYDNITFEKIAKLLNTDKDTIEKTAAVMISQGRLKASLDQTRGLIYFQKSEDVVSIDQQFLRACQEARQISEQINAVRATLDHASKPSSSIVKMEEDKQPLTNA